MALDLTALSVPLMGGLDLKTSRFLTQSSRALVAQNVIQSQPGKVEKRSGFAPIQHPSQTSCNWCGVLGVGTPGSTSLGQELLIGGNVGGSCQQHGWSPASGTWIQKGSVQPLACTTKTAFAGNFDCQSTDVAVNKNTPIAGGEYGCYAYETPTGVNFTVVDDANGQTVMANQVLAAPIVVGGVTKYATQPRVVSIGPFFVIFCTQNGALNAYTINPFQQTMQQFSVFPAGQAKFDARAVTNAPANIGHSGNYVFVASSGKTTDWSVLGFDPWQQATFSQSTVASGNIEAIAVGVFASNVGVIFTDSSVAQVAIEWLDLSLGLVQGQTLDLATAGSNTWGKLTLQPSAIGFTAAWETLGTQDNAGDFLTLPSIRTASGTVASSSSLTATYIKRNESIAGDLFTLNGITYLPTVYQGNYSGVYTQMQSLQPTYFLLQLTSSVAANTTTASAVEVARIAQTNAGGPTLRKMCPQVSVDLAGNIIWGIGLGTQQTAAFNGSYQNVRAVARAVVTFGVQPFSKTLGQDLHLTGGFLSAYDGAAFTEHGFHVKPEAPKVNACTVGCCRVQIGNPNAGFLSSASGFIGDSNDVTQDQGGVLVNSGLVFTAIAAGSTGNAITVQISPNNQNTGPTTVTVVGRSVLISPQCGSVSPHPVIETDGGVISAIAAYNAANPASALVTAALAAGTTGGAGTTLANAPTSSCVLSGGGIATSATPTALTPTNFTQDPQSFQASLSPVPILGTVQILDAGTVVASDAENPGTIAGTDNGANVTGTVTTAGDLTITIAGNGNQFTGGAMTVAYSSSPVTPEINDVYFPPDTSNPGDLIYGSGWQVRPSSYVLITAQSKGISSGVYFQADGVTQGGPVGYVWFSVDGVGADPAPYTSGGVNCALLSTDTAAQCAQKFRQAINNGYLATYVTASAVVQNVAPPTGISTAVTSKVTVTSVLGLTYGPGSPLTYSDDFRLDCYTASGNTSGSWMACPPASKIMPGGYFVVPTNYAINNQSVMLIFWYAVSYNGGASYTGTAPAVVGQASIGNLLLPVLGSLGSAAGSTVQQIIQINVMSSDTPSQVATKTVAALAPFEGGNSAFPYALAGPFGASIQIALWNNSTVAYLTPYNVSCGGILPDGQYQYANVDEWNDGKGQLHQSANSDAYIVNVVGASPTFDPFGLRYDATGSVVAQASDQHGMTLFGFPVGGSSPLLVMQPLWATQKLNSTRAVYRTLVSAGNALEYFRATDQSLTATQSATSAIANPNPTLPNSLATVNPLTGFGAPPDVQVFIDTTPDSQLNSNAALYTNGGVEQNAPVPSCAYLHVHRGRLWAVLKENPNQLWYSQVFSPESQFGVTFSEALTVDIDAEAGNIIGLGTCDAWLIVFCQYGMFAIGGDGPTAAGQGDFEPPIRIMTDSGGCIAPGSIIEQPQGLWYQSAKGLYFMDRALKITPEGLDYNTLVTGHTCNSAIIIPANQEILWFMSAVPNAAQPGSDYALYYNPFTHFKSSHLKRAGSCATVWNGTLVWVDAAGNVNVDTPGVYLDNGAPIPFVYQTAHIGRNATGTPQGYMRVRWGYVVGDYISPANLKIQVAYDYEPPSKQILGAGQPTDGTRFQWRFAIPPGPTGGRIQAISLVISDYGDTGNLGGFSVSDITLGLGIFHGGFRAGVSRSTG